MKKFFIKTKIVCTGKFRITNIQQKEFNSALTDRQHLTARVKMLMVPETSSV